MHVPVAARDARVFQGPPFTSHPIKQGVRADPSNFKHSRANIYNPAAQPSKADAMTYVLDLLTLVKCLGLRSAPSFSAMLVKIHAHVRTSTSASHFSSRRRPRRRQSLDSPHGLRHSQLG